MFHTLLCLIANCEGSGGGWNKTWARWDSFHSYLKCKVILK